MCSKTHSAQRGDGDRLARLEPCSVIETTSPGWTSRRNFAPMMSKAQVSDATQYVSPSMPSDERAQAERIAEGDDAVLGHDDGAVGALDARR